VSTYSLSHLSDQTLLHSLAALVSRDRANTAALLAHLAEVDARKLYLPAAYPSMYAYCVAELHLCEQAAFRRIRAARTAREFPAILPALADGRVHLTAVLLLAPYLTPENAEGLLAAAAHRNRVEIEELLARQFPRPDLPTLVRPLASPESEATTPQLSPATVGASAATIGQLSPATVGPAAPAVSEPAATRPRLAPLASERFALQVTIARATRDKLRHAQDLLSSQIPSGDVAEVLDRALDVLIERLEKRKFAASSQPRPRQSRSAASGRHVPAEVRRAVWARDGGRCTFVSENGHRCPAQKFLEFDHVQELARGGVATVSGMRLRCRAHNQYTAERTYGSEFMRHKREQARRAASPADETRAS